MASAPSGASGCRSACPPGPARPAPGPAELGQDQLGHQRRPRRPPDRPVGERCGNSSWYCSLGWYSIGQRLGVVRAAGLDGLFAFLGRRLQLARGKVGEQPARPRPPSSCRTGPTSGRQAVCRRDSRSVTARTTFGHPGAAGKQSAGPERGVGAGRQTTRGRSRVTRRLRRCRRTARRRPSTGIVVRGGTLAACASRTRDRPRRPPVSGSWWR